MRPSLLILTLASLSTSACVTVGRDYQPPPAETIAKVEDLRVDLSERFALAEPVAAWWRQFDDPLLARLCEEALASNHEVRVAIENVIAARAFLDRRQLDRLPTATARADYARVRLSESEVFGASADRTIDVYDSGFDAFWELDLFGRVTRLVEGAEARAGASEADLADAYVLVSAEVARNYMLLRGSQNERAVAERNRHNQRESVELTSILDQYGRATELDVARAQSQLSLTEATLPPLDAAIERTIHRLSVLTGRPPSALAQELREPRPLPSLPEAVAIGDGAGLLRRRPDVRRAERALAAATADYGVAVADLYPRISLLGSIGFRARSASDLFSSEGFTLSVGPSLDWAAFDLGRVRVSIRQADATARAALARFEQRLLLALEEVQTALSDFAREEERRRELVKAAAAAATAAELARVRYEGGFDSFLAVLDAERVQLDAERQLAVSETTTALFLVAIYKALGGGWQAVEASAEER